MTFARSAAALAVASLALPGIVHAADDVDWKYYGGGPIGKVSTSCFYDSKGIVHEPGGLVRVWAKCIDRKAMDDVPLDSPAINGMIEEAGKKAARYYIPPLFLIHKVENAGQVMTVTFYEVYANRAEGMPTARFLYEINCTEQKSREDSIWIQGGVQDDRTTDWRYVDPEGNGHDLMRLICR